MVFSLSTHCSEETTNKKAIWVPLQAKAERYCMPIMCSVQCTHILEMSSTGHKGSGATSILDDQDSISEALQRLALRKQTNSTARPPHHPTAKLAWTGHTHS